MNILITKGTKSMQRNALRSFLSFKQFAKLKGRNRMQMKRMSNKRLEINPPSDVKITFNVSKIKKSVQPNLTFSLNVLSENGNVFV